MTLQERIDKRNALVTQMRAILDKASKDGGRDLTAEEEQEYNRMDAEVSAHTKAIDRERALEQTQSQLNQSRDTDYLPPVDDSNMPAAQQRAFAGRRSPEYLKAFIDGFCRVGKNNLGPQYLNALQVGTDAEGGYLVPEEFETAIITYLQTADPIRARATVIRTASDRNIPLETDRGAFAYIAEEGAYTEDDPAFNRQVLSAYKAGGIIKVSEELIQDGFFDLQTYLQDNAGRRYAALEEASFANGDGTGKPTGLFQTTAVGGVSASTYTGAVSATPAIASDDIIETFHTLGRSYRGRATWVAGDAVTKLLRKLKDSNNQYLWQPGLLASQPDSLMGRPFIVTDGAPAPVVTGKSIWFGDLSRYVIVERLGMAMQRLNELYAANGQVGFRFSMRHDAKSVDAKSFVTFTHGAAS